MLGGVLASRGRVSLPLLIVVVVVAAVTGPLVGYEIGRHLGGRLIARAADAPGGRRRGPGRGGPAPAGRPRGAARPVRRGAARPDARGRGHHPDALPDVPVLRRARRPYLGRRLLPARLPAGSAYAAIERAVGTGVAIAVAVVVLGAVAFWVVRRHRREAAELVTDPDPALPDPATRTRARNARLSPEPVTICPPVRTRSRRPGLLNQHAGKISSPSPDCFRGPDRARA